MKQKNIIIIGGFGLIGRAFINNADNNKNNLIIIDRKYLRTKNKIDFYKSNIDNDEYRSMLKTLDLFNAKLIDTYKIPFDFINKNRVLIIVQKMNDIDNKYPRSNNKPFRKPLF